MASFTVQSAQYKTEKTINGAPMHIYTLSVVDANSQVVGCEILQRPSSPAPAPGMVIEGEMKPSNNPQFPPTLKRTQQASGGSGGGGGYDNPETVARITRCHSQDMAIGFLKATGGVNINYAADEAEVTKAIERHLSTVRKLANWFDADVAKAAKPGTPAPQQAAAPAPAPSPQRPPAQQAPPPQQPPAQQAPPAQAPPF